MQGKPFADHAQVLRPTFDRQPASAAGDRQVAFPDGYVPDGYVPVSVGDQFPSEGGGRFPVRAPRSVFHARYLSGIRGTLLGVAGKARAWTVPPGAWRRKAACVDSDPEVFFPEDVGGRSRSGSRTRDPYAEARAICADCPVTEPCLEEALADPETPGMWGGTTEGERRQIRADRRKAKS